MSIFDRIGTILKANINDLLDQAEDPEKMINQLIRDMEGQLKEARGQVAEAMAQERKLEREALAAEALVEQWHGKAVLAVQRGDDDLAKQALARKIAYEKKATSLRTELEEQETAVTNMQEQLHALQAKIEDAKRQKDVLLTKHKRVKAQETIRRSRLDLSRADDALSAFARMKEKIEDQEDIAAAAAELEKAEVETRFEKLEAESDLDAELAALKAEVQGGTG
jgi:phage shock protein A